MKQLLCFSVVLAVIGKKKKTSKRIHGFILSQKTDNASCGLGEFGVRKGKRATPATVKPGCDELILDGSTDIAKTRRLKWTAPKCGCVTIR